MPIAFKEWAVTVRALAEGEQLLTLRKGGSARPRSTSGSPTSASSSTPPSTISATIWCASPTSPSCAARSRRACGATASRRCTRSSSARLQQPDRVRIRAWAEVAGHFTIIDPRCVDALSPFYVWTPDYAEKRLGWKRRQPLHVLLLRTYRIPRPVTVKVKDEYGGCSAWLELQRELPFEGTPVLSDAEFERAAEEISSITREAGQPVLV